MEKGDTTREKIKRDVDREKDIFSGEAKRTSGADAIKKFTPSLGIPSLGV